MKIEKISDTSVKLTLTSRDFEERSLDAAQLEADSPVYQKLIWDALEHAEIELGLHIETGRVRVESVSSGDDRVEITVTNLPGTVAEKKTESSEETERPMPRQAIAVPAALLTQMIRNGLLPAVILNGTRRGSAEEQEENGPEEAGESVLIPEMIYRENVRAEFPDRTGTGVICFRNYNALYDFFRANRSFAVLSSALYMLEDAFYLVITDRGRHRTMLSHLEVRLSDADAIVLPAELLVPMLREYGKVLFARGAIRKITESLG